MTDIEPPEMIEVPITEFKIIRQLADAISSQNMIVLQGQEQIVETMRALLIELGKQETLVIPAPEVTVKAAQITMPDMPAPVVTVMEAPEARRTVVITVERTNGLITRLKGTIE